MKALVICLACFVVATMVNYGLALAGEPRALWLFRDVLGLV